MLSVLSFIYAIVVFADVYITILAVNSGVADELNVLLAPLVKKPILFVMAEFVLLVVVVGVAFILDSYSMTGAAARAFMCLAIFWRGIILANNIMVVRDKQ